METEPIIIEIDRLSLKEEFRNLPLMDVTCEHLRILPEEDEILVLVDGDEEWEKKSLGRFLDIGEDYSNAS